MLHWNFWSSHVAVFCLLFLGHFRQVCSQCTPPISGSWYRPYDKATITFTGSELKGHVTPIKDAVYQDYACWKSTGSKYVFRLETRAQGANGFVIGYFCWQLVPLTPTTALLYQLTSDSTVFKGQVHDVPEGGGDPSITDVCSLGSTVEYPSILYKVSSTTASDVNVTTASLARQNCPADALATYSYQPCSDGVSQLDFCLDRQTARVDANCTNKILFSNDAVLSCLAQFTRGDKLFMILLNEDSTLTADTARFACLEIEGAGSAVAYKDHCTNSANSPALTMTKTASCPTDDGGGGTDIVPIIVGVVVAVVIVIAVLVVLYVLYKKGRMGPGRRAITPMPDVLKPKAGELSKPPEDSQLQNGTAGANPGAANGEAVNTQPQAKLSPIQNNTQGTSTTPAEGAEIQSPRKLPPITAVNAATSSK